MAVWLGRVYNVDLIHNIVDEETSVPSYKYGDAPRASVRHAGKARDLVVLSEYVAGSGTQQERMQRGSNAIVFVRRGTKYESRLVTLCTSLSRDAGE